MDAPNCRIREVITGRRPTPFSICIGRKGHKHVRWMLPCRTIHWLDKSIVAKCKHTVDGCIVEKNCKENYKYESAN